MRRIGWLVVILMVLGWSASQMPSAAGRGETTVDSGWRRAAGGWEHRNWWPVPKATRRVPLHPGLISLMEIFLAAGALVAFSSRKKKEVWQGLPPHTRRPGPPRTPSCNWSSVVPNRPTKASLAVS